MIPQKFEHGWVFYSYPVFMKKNIRTRINWRNSLLSKGAETA